MKVRTLPTALTKAALRAGVVLSVSVGLPSVVTTVTALLSCTWIEIAWPTL